MDETSIISMITNTAAGPSMFVTIIGVLSAVAFAAALITKIGALLLPYPKETRVADFLPFSSLDKDGATIHCKNGSLARVFEIRGLDLTLLTPEDRKNLVEMRKRWVDSMAETEIVARVITMRELVKLDKSNTQTNPVTKQISDMWMNALDRVFTNKHYIVLSVNDRKNAMRDLGQASDALTSILADYSPVLISEKTPHKHRDKSPFWLFARLASPVTRPQPVIGNNTGDLLNSLLTADAIHFTKDEGLIRFFSGDREKYCAVIGIRKPGDFMNEQMIETLSSLSVELTITHNINPMPYAKANALLMQQQTQARITSPSVGVYQQYAKALSKLDPSDEDAQTLDRYAMTIYLFGTKEEVQYGQEEVERICRLFDITPSREGWGAQPAFFAQFPTYDVYPKTFLYLSRVVACSLGLNTTATGLMKSDWGNVPVSYFSTAMGTPYAFQFHVSSEPYATAHAVVIGPTGKGKTTLFSFLAGQAMRFPDLNVYFFDRGNGAKIFAMALDAPYIRFEGDEGSTTLNPFALEDTPYARAFLRSWLSNITGRTDDMSLQEIARAVTTSYDYLRPEERVLKNLHTSCFAPTSPMRSALTRWVKDDVYGRIFNSVEDNLDVNAHQYMAFDFTYIFQDPVLAPAVISYLMYRIQSVATAKGTPSLVMIDETAPMLEHPMFKDEFIKGLREGRKKRQAFLCAFQQPSFLENAGLGDVVRGQCPTKIFFPNDQAMPVDYAGWSLTPRELSFILGKEFNMPHGILIKRDQESVILDIDLSGLGPYLRLYSSGNKDVLLAEQLKRQFPDQQQFVKAFLEHFQ